MERILLRNGIPEPMPRIEGTYLYQTLHVRGRRPKMRMPLHSLMQRGT